jgi:hypothetical protein
MTLLVDFIAMAAPPVAVFASMLVLKANVAVALCTCMIVLGVWFCLYSWRTKP